MAIRQLSRTDWASYCDRVSRELQGKRARLEVATLSLGNQVLVNSASIMGITYDRKDDILELSLDGLDHMIPKPRSIAVDEGAAGLTGLQVVDGDGRTQIITLAESLKMPAP